MPETGHSPAILLMATSEAAVNLDRRFLRDAGYPNSRFTSSGAAAARYLARTNRPDGAFDPDLIICQQQLQDMEAEQFCAILHQHPLLKNLPVLMIMPNDHEAAQAQALGSAASMILGRPYSLDTLKKRIDALYKAGETYRRNRSAGLQTDAAAFEDALATGGVLLRAEHEPEDYFRAGLRFLGESRWALAIQAFGQALGEEEIKAEATLGLAAAYKGKGDIHNARNALADAAEAFVAEKRWHRARTTYARLLQHDPSARNPFLTEAHRLIREKDYDGAAETLSQSLSLLPKIKASERLARICLAAEEPQKMFDSLAAELESGQTYAFLATQVRQTLSQMEQQREERLRMQAAERKWQLAQNIKSRAAQENKETLSPADRQLRLANAIEALDNTRKAESVQDWGQPDWDLEPELEENPVKPFAKKGFLSEIFSLIRFTWQLDKKSRKRN